MSLPLCPQAAFIGAIVMASALQQLTGSLSTRSGPTALGHWEDEAQRALLGG